MLAWFKQKFFPVKRHKISATLQKDLEAKRKKIRKNVLRSLSDMYSDPAEWAESSDDLVSYAIFYHTACNQWFKAMLALEAPVIGYGRQFLAASTDAEFDEGGRQSHHYSLLRGYAIDRVAVRLVLDAKLDPQWLQQAATYHSAHLREYDYHTDAEAIAELDANTMLSTMVPQLIINQLQGVESPQMQNIVRNLQASEKIWLYALHLLRGISGEDEARIEDAWHNLLWAWKTGFTEMNFDGFSFSQLVLLYFLYCRSNGQDFDLHTLSHKLVAAS